MVRTLGPTLRLQSQSSVRNCSIARRGGLTALIEQQNQDVDVRMGMPLTAPITTHGNEGDIVSLLPARSEDPMLR